MRHALPQHYIEWLNIASRTPRICHSCDHYSTTGMCTQFDMEPPEDFAATKDVCDSWLLEVGF